MTPYIEAEYKDGYIHSELELDDTSPFVEGKNIFHDILEGHPVAEHGEMVRFTLHTDTDRYDIDWTVIPENSRPIRYKKMECDFNPGGQQVGDVRMVSLGFGYQYLDDKGRNQQVIEAIGL